MKAARTRALHRKHAGTGKHHSTAKHTPTAHRGGATGHKQVSRRVHLTHKAARARALSAGDVSCCVVDALAWSLRLAGGSVSDSDVLALFRLAGGDADAGVTILAALEAASEFGLGGVQPVSYEPVGLDVIHEAYQHLILGVELPGSHALVAVGDGPWITWGEELDPAGFPDAVIEEAWAVTWP